MDKTNFSESILSRARLRDASMDGADFRGAVLCGCDMSGSAFQGANFSGADMAGADLSASYLAGVDLTGADLNGANLDGASFDGANLYSANITGVTGIPVEKIDDAIGFGKSLAKELMGQGSIVTSARPGVAYWGEILSVTDNGLHVLALMAVSDTQAIMHEIPKTDAAPNDLETGKEITLLTDAEGYSRVQARNETQRPEREREGMRR
jgi:hypothetical protein